LEAVCVLMGSDTFKSFNAGCDLSNKWRGRSLVVNLCILRTAC
jgi:hypothetical protein